MRMSVFTRVLGPSVGGEAKLPSREVNSIVFPRDCSPVTLAHPRFPSGLLISVVTLPLSVLSDNGHIPQAIVEFSRI